MDLDPAVTYNKDSVQSTYIQGNLCVLESESWSSLSGEQSLDQSWGSMVLLWFLGRWAKEYCPERFKRGPLNLRECIQNDISRIVVIFTMKQLLWLIFLTSMKQSDSYNQDLADPDTIPLLRAQTASSRFGSETVLQDKAISTRFKCYVPSGFGRHH